MKVRLYYSASKAHHHIMDKESACVSSSVTPLYSDFPAARTRALISLLAFTGLDGVTPSPPPLIPTLLLLLLAKT